MDSLEGAATPRLLQFPDEILLEILLEIAPSPAIKELRCLGRVNRRLRSFANDYLARYRYNTGIFRLPNELLLMITRDLDSQRQRSRFARYIRISTVSL